MPRRPAKLSNCYVPLPLPPSQVENVNNNEETSVISSALGSSLVELGHTKILAEVHIAAATTNVSNKSSSASGNNNEANNDIGCLRCHVKYAPHIGIDQVSQRSRSVTALDGSSNNNNKSGTATTSTQSAGKLNQELTLRRESDLSRRLTAALLPVVILEQYPKCAIVINLTVLQDDGSCLSASITAASMALVDALVELRDVVTSCTVAVVDRGCCKHNEEDRWIYLADPTEREATSSTLFASDTTTTTTVALICLAMTPNHKEVTLWSQSGRLSSDMASHAMELCRDGCRTMHNFMRESLI
eukprot:CAMPEP_0170793418 /NCGR_PEP_ID=MMETSP0733-20121128/22648_1 /TAXON_ID=186038 /ORGANISM="Fragilariopsis kerguelensis, Strain L26-C5" /LENGTH=301 /DNA_ID=CAMNT_0011142375 /DNA_START=19 /DNA_END=922 /DNA_ORIENTATION=-